MTNTPTYDYECFEAGCSSTFSASSEDQLVEVVNGHMASAHNTFELEDVIIANAALREGD